jgi:hypothetical protein
LRLLLLFPLFSGGGSTVLYLSALGGSSPGQP